MNHIGTLLIFMNQILRSIVLILLSLRQNQLYSLLMVKFNDFIISYQSHQKEKQIYGKKYLNSFLLFNLKYQLVGQRQSLNHLNATNAQIIFNPDSSFITWLYMANYTVSFLRVFRSLSFTGNNPTHVD